jgi:hypothetical protein
MLILKIYTSTLVWLLRPQNGSVNSTASFAPRSFRWVSCNKDYHSYGPKAFSSSDAAPTQVTCHQLERPRMAVTLPLVLSVHSRNRKGFELATQAPTSCFFDAPRNLGGAYDVIDSTRGCVFNPNWATSDLSTLHIDTIQHQGRSWSMTVLPSSNVPPLQVEAWSSIRITMPTFTVPRQHVPQPARPSHTEEQRPVTMYYRIIQELS